MGVIHRTYLICDICGKEVQVPNEFTKVDNWSSGMELKGRIFAYCSQCIKEIDDKALAALKAQYEAKDLAEDCSKAWEAYKLKWGEA